MTFALIALGKAVQLLRELGNFRLLLECATACAAAVLAHPFEGMFSVLAVLMLALGSLSLDGFGSVRKYLAATGVGIAAGAPLLRTWWPSSTAALLGGMGLFATIPLMIRLGKKPNRY